MITLKTTLLLKIIHGGGGGNSLINNGLDTYTHYIDDYSFLDVKEITNTPQDNKYLSSLGLSADTNLREYLPKGTKYTILAYKKIENRNSYTFHKQQEFTVGDINPKIELDSEQNYTLIVVSTGSNISPRIENENDFNRVRFIAPNYPYYTNFLYQKIENFIPSGDRNNVLNIKLGGSSRIKLIIDLSELYPDNYLKPEGIESVSAKINYKIAKNVKLINRTANIEDYSTSIVPIKSTRFLNNQMQYEINLQDIFLIENQNSRLVAELQIKAKGHDVIFENSFVYLFPYYEGKGIHYRPSKPGYKHTIVIKPKVCGAYTKPNKTDFREFICEDRFIHIWGKKANYEEIVKNNIEADPGHVWREEENPCLAGYRVPTIDEWRTILDERNNTRKIYYRWTGLEEGWKLGERMIFEFPRKDLSCAWWSSSTTYSSSSNLKDYINFALCVGIKGHGILKEVQQKKNYYSLTRLKCIKKLPNE